MLIVALLAILLYISYTLKSSLETSINAYLATLKEDISALEYEPFSCYGVANISCASHFVAIADIVESKEISLGFGSLQNKQKLTLWIEAKEIEFIKDTSTHSLLRVFFALPKVDLSDNLFPTYINCEIENNLLDSSSHALQPQVRQTLTPQYAESSQNLSSNTNNSSADSRTHIAHIAKCNLKAQNMRYLLKAELQQSLQNTHQSTNTIKDILINMYKTYANTPNAFMEESRIWIDSINLTLTPNKLDSAIAQWLHKQYIPQNPQDNIKDLNTNLEKEKILKERFDKAIQESANIATYTFSFVSSNKDTRKAIMEGVNGFSNLLQGESIEVSYELLPKHTRYFRLSDIIDTPSAVLNLANFALKVKQVPKETQKD